MSKELIQNLLKQNANSQDFISEIVSKNTTPNAQELIQQGLAVFEKLGLQTNLLALNFLNTGFSAMIDHNHKLTAMEKISLQNIFENEIGYPIDFLL